MPGDYSIVEAQLPLIGGLGGHNLLVLKDDQGNVVKELDGLATGADGAVKPIGYLPSDTLKVYEFNAATYYAPGEAQVTLQSGSQADIMKVWNAAETCATAINAKSLSYPFLGFGKNSNSVTSTLDACMGKTEPSIPGGALFTPGQGSLLLDQQTIDGIRNAITDPNTTPSGGNAIDPASATPFDANSIADDLSEFVLPTTGQGGEDPVDVGDAIADNRAMAGAIAIALTNGDLDAGSFSYLGGGFTVQVDDASTTIQNGANVTLSTSESINGLDYLSQTTYGLDGSYAQNWSSSDGSHGDTSYDNSSGVIQSDTFNADGSSHGETDYSDGTVTTYANDTEGNEEHHTTYADGSGSDSYEHVDGSSEGDAYYSDGSSSNYWYGSDGVSYYTEQDNTDGSYSDSYNDGERYGTDTVNADGSGTSEWHSLDGTSFHTEQDNADGSYSDTYSYAGDRYGSDSVNADGSSATEWHGFDGASYYTGEVNADGSYSDSYSYADDKFGSDDFNADGSGTSEWQGFDGTSFYTEQVNADGSYSDSYSYAGYRYGSDAVNSDGSSSTEWHSFDGVSYYTRQVNADGSNSDTYSYAGDRYGSDTLGSDGSMATEWHTYDGTSSYEFQYDADGAWSDSYSYAGDRYGSDDFSADGSGTSDWHTFDGSSYYTSQRNADGSYTDSFDYAGDSNGDDTRNADGSGESHRYFYGSDETDTTTFNADGSFETVASRPGYEDDYQYALDGSYTDTWSEGEDHGMSSYDATTGWSETDRVTHHSDGTVDESDLKDNPDGSFQHSFHNTYTDGSWSSQNDFYDATSMHAWGDWENSSGDSSTSDVTQNADGSTHSHFYTTTPSAGGGSRTEDRTFFGNGSGTNYTDSVHTVSPDGSWQSTDTTGFDNSYYTQATQDSAGDWSNATLDGTGLHGTGFIASSGTYYTIGA